MSETESQRDWREWAYLQKENWPEAIPEMGPKREYGPYPWGKKRHNDPDDLDSYPSNHPDASSCGDMYMGDVCPYCGVPVRLDSELVNIHGEKGEGRDISPGENPIPIYHPDCWKDREATKNAQEHRQLTEWSE